MLGAVRNDLVEFVTVRPEGSTFATLERRVVVTGPPALVELSYTGDTGVLDGLIPLLKDRDRAWAAEVMLAAMTGHEAKLVDSFARDPDAWWEAMGTTAFDRWSAWLDERKERLSWDAQSHVFVEKEE